MINKPATETYELTRSDQPGVIIKKTATVKAGSANLVSHTSSLFLKHPKLLIPILGAWIAIAFILTRALNYLDLHPSAGLLAIIIITLSAICGTSLLTCLANSVLLEMIQEYRERRTWSILRGIGATLIHNFLSLILVGIVWGILWISMVFVFGVIRSLFSSLFGRLGAIGADVSESLVEHRMELRVFAILPAIAWENYGPLGAWSRSDRVLLATRDLYNDSYWQTFLFGLVLGLPLLLLSLFSGGTSLEYIDPVLLVIYFGYAALAWSLRMYTNQLVVAHLYLCSDELDAAQAANPHEAITLHDIDLPALIPES